MQARKKSAKGRKRAQKSADAQKFETTRFGNSQKKSLQKRSHLEVALTLSQTQNAPFNSIYGNVGPLAETPAQWKFGHTRRL